MRALMDYVCDRLDEVNRKVEDGRILSNTELQYADTLAHLKKNLLKASATEEEHGGSSYRRGRAMNGRFVSRDASEMSRRLRDLIDDAPDDTMRHEIAKLADKIEDM